MLRRFRQILLQNLGIKLTSVLLALAVYLHVFSREQAEMEFSCPVEIIGLPDGLAWSGDPLPAPRVLVRGSGADLVRLRARPPRFEVRLEGAHRGLLQRPLSIEDLIFPSGVAAKAEPLRDRAVLALLIEPKTRAVLPVRIRVEGRPAPGYSVRSVAVAWPETIRVEGPESLVHGTDSLETEVLILDGRSKDVEEKLRLRVPAGISLSTEEIVARVRIGPS